MPTGDLLTSTPSPLPPSPAAAAVGTSGAPTSGLVDLGEFETLEKSGEGQQLTSNVAILAGEFAQVEEEVADEFDDAFDALAQESATKSKLEDLEREFGEDDVFDTGLADKILNLTSLANKVLSPEEEEKAKFDEFDDPDKDPFDTSGLTTNNFPPILLLKIFIGRLHKTKPLIGSVYIPVLCQ